MIVQHYSENGNAGTNPLMVSALPAHVFGVRMVENVDDALRDFELARAETEANTGVPKSMAMGIYGTIIPEGLAEKARNLAYDISINKSPVLDVSGRVHQGYNLNEILTK